MSKCVSCNGSGKCTACDGTGFGPPDPAPAQATPDDEFALAPEEPICTKCGGSGRCLSCEGTGEKGR